MLKDAFETTEKYGLISEGDKITAALSGGPDSTALLFFLCEIRKTLNIEVSALHVNHMLRGDESERDALFAEELCKKHGIPFAKYEADVSHIAAEKKLSIEEAGRKARYEAFKNGLERFGSDKIATGHNKNDSAETFLMNLARGAGMRGLTGLAPISRENDVNICVIRPLINCDRAQIEKWCAQNNIPTITDSTNLQTVYTRNKIRLELLPWLKNNVNHDIVGTITACAEILSEQNALLEALAQEAFSDCMTEPGKTTTITVSLDISKLEKLHPALMKLTIREALKALCGSLNNIGAIHINDVLSLMEKGTGKRISLPGGIVCETRYGFLDFKMAEKETQDFCSQLSETPVYIKQKGCYATFSEMLLNIDNLKNLCTKMYKCDNILSEVFLRTRLPGDRIKLPGGTKKLGDYYTDKKIPRVQRAQALLVAEGGNVLSVLGVCDSEQINHGEQVYYFQLWEDTDGNG